MLKKLVVCLLFLCAAGVWAAGGAGDVNLTSEEANALARMPLAGLKSVALTVSVDDNLKKLGLDEGLVRGACTLRLKIAGVKVVDSPSTEETGLLLVDVKSAKIEDLPLYAVCVNVDMYDKVTLPRAPVFKLPVIVWHESKVGYSGSDEVSKLTLLVNPLVDAFAKDFAIANTKPQNVD